MYVMFVVRLNCLCVSEKENQCPVNTGYNSNPKAKKSNGLNEIDKDFVFSFLKSKVENNFFSPCFP